VPSVVQGKDCSTCVASLGNVKDTDVIVRNLTDSFHVEWTGVSCIRHEVARIGDHIDDGAP
jgi:hypothetical protein